MIGWAALGVSAHATPAPPASVELGSGRAYTTLQEAVDAAGPGGTVVVYPGTYTGAEITDDLEIAATELGTAVIGPGLDAGAAIDVHAGVIVLRGLVLDGEGIARGLDATDGRVTVEDVTFRNGAAIANGGCARLDTVPGTFRRVSFTGCAAGRDGGALYAVGGDLTLDDVSVAGSAAADGVGGGIAAYDLALAARGLALEANTADDPTGRVDGRGQGGGLFVSGGVFTVDGGAALANEARSIHDEGGVGGAIEAVGSVGTIAGMRFEGNVAAERGSGVDVPWGDVTVTGSWLVDNLVDDLYDGATYGGTVFCGGGADCLVERSWFERNTAGDGAGVCAIGDLTVRTSMFCSNTAASDGGAVDVGNMEAYADIELDANVVALNTAVGEGGGIVVSDGPVIVHNNHVVGNSSQRNVAIAVTETGTLEGLLVSSNLVADNDSDEGAVVSFEGVIHAEEFDWFSGNTPYDLDEPLGIGSGTGSPGLAGRARSCDVADLALAEDSPLRDAGDPTDSRRDNDGSENDIGAFGGPFADAVALGDSDGDGWPGITDCDDQDPARGPDVAEVCNGVDDDCDGLVDDDEAASDAAWLHLDDDGDGVGAPGPGTFRCPKDGWTAVGGDCDDTNPAVTAGSVWFPDGDGDGYGDDRGEATLCDDAPEGWVEVGGDCDDTDPTLTTRCDIPGDADGDGAFDDGDPDPGDAGGATGGPPLPTYGCGCAEAGGGAEVAPFALALALRRGRRRQRG